MTQPDLFTPALPLDDLRRLLAGLAARPDALTRIGELVERVEQALESRSALALLSATPLAAALAEIPDLGLHELPRGSGEALAAGCTDYLARCRRWLALAPVVAELGRRLGGRGALKPQVLAEAARALEEYGLLVAPQVVLRPSAAAWDPGGVVLADLDATFRSTTLARFYGSPLLADEEAEFALAEGEGPALGWPDRVALFAATIGPGLEERARGHFAEKSPFAGVVLDALASALVEQLCAALLGLVADRGLLPAPAGGGRFRRYHLGYGDWPLGQQEVLFKALAPERIGLSLTASHLMLPEKSVAGLVAAKMPRRRGEG